jgi:hypothetical protein
MARYDAKCAFKRLMKEAKLKAENERLALANVGITTEMKISPIEINRVECANGNLEITYEYIMPEGYCGRIGLTPDDGRADLEPLGVTGAQLAEQFMALNIDVQIQEAPRSVEDVAFLEREHQAICAYGREHGYH